MLFNFQSFIEELREKAEKKEIVEKYEKHFGPLVGDVKDQIRYKEYLINFSGIDYAVPEELKEEFDRKLLLQLVSASFSSECIFEKREQDDLRDFIISVKSGDQSVVKKVSELRSFQILRLYEIYIEEQMNLQILVSEDEKEKAAIMSQRQARLQRRKTVLDTLDKEKLEKEAAVEKEEKLGDLYSQL